ncbi:hypothetical protein OJAV_G00229500 [Oryzias javanicus]|uniref:Dynein regulatory complex protein 1 n=1 Tax=Oryzias javanicus TaxID=123683 RepID=A0A437BZ89_ORYJA|nr:hypothetical protein OJAV_G00229500 [Oryzias javanicus]
MEEEEKEKTSFSAISSETNSSSTSSNVEIREEPNEEDKTQEDPEVQSQMRILSLHRDLTAALTNIQTAAVAKVARTKLENAQGTIEELQEKEEQSSQQILEEILGGWTTAHHKEVHQDLQEALEDQQRLCAAVITDKKRLINDLKQELNRRHESYVRNLRQNAEELNLVTVMMEEKMKIMTDVYKEEMEQMERIHQQEVEILRSKDKDHWEQQIKALCDKELQLLKERNKKVKEYEEKCHDKIYTSVIDKARNAVSVKDFHRKFPGHFLVPQNSLPTKLMQQSNETSAFLNKRIVSLKKDIKKLQKTYTEKERELQNCTHKLQGEYQRSFLRAQKFHQRQMKSRNNSATDAKKLKELQRMIDGELKQLSQRALTIDSLICQYVGVPWKTDNTDMREHPGPERLPDIDQWNPETDKCSRGMIEDENKEETLCVETPLQNEMGSPAGCGGSVKAAEASDPINSASVRRKHTLPPLKRESSAEQTSSSGPAQVWDVSEVCSRWERLADIIPEEKVRRWETAEKKLLQYYWVLREISDLTRETEELKRRNLQLKSQLQERSISWTPASR